MLSKRSSLTLAARRQRLRVFFAITPIMKMTENGGNADNFMIIARSVSQHAVGAYEIQGSIFVGAARARRLRSRCDGPSARWEVPMQMSPLESAKWHVRIRHDVVFAYRAF